MVLVEDKSEKIKRFFVIRRKVRKTRRIIKKKTPKIFHFINYPLWIRKFIAPRVIYKITKKEKKTNGVVA